ncbi:hypothetical protein KR074_008454 [Drosophila pseudoananassae]|nr:hypothetical protein KR074_008454 [Drosophila pseudoananassae]
MMSRFIFLLAFAAYIIPIFAFNNYLWGEISPNDYILAKDKVSKPFFVGLVQTKKYVFKQKDNLNALSISAIKITDKKEKNGATAELLSGGPGSKGATILFQSKRGYEINDVVEIWGR